VRACALWISWRFQGRQCGNSPGHTSFAGRRIHTHNNHHRRSGSDDVLVCSKTSRERQTESGGNSLAAPLSLSLYCQLFACNERRIRTMAARAVWLWVNGFIWHVAITAAPFPRDNLLMRKDFQETSVYFRPSIHLSDEISLFDLALRLWQYINILSRWWRRSLTHDAGVSRLYYSWNPYV
jgi:hypothetical protein